MQPASAPVTASAPPPAPVAPPAPAASPNYTPPPAAAPPPSPSMANGGPVKSNPIKEFFSDINLMDVTISAFIVAGVIYSIQYHRFMMMIEKTGYADLSNRLQRMESSMAAAKKTAEANASGGMRARRRARITL